MNKKKGFTLAELLIVVAIIAVLVGIAIPVFTSQLNKSQQATDMANIRSEYARVVTAAMTDGNPDPATGKYLVTLDKTVATNGSTVTYSANTITVTLGSITSTFNTDTNVTVTLSP